MVTEKTCHYSCAMNVLQYNYFKDALLWYVTESWSNLDFLQCLCSHILFDLTHENSRVECDLMYSLSQRNKNLTLQTFSATTNVVSQTYVYSKNSELFKNARKVPFPDAFMFFLVIKQRSRIRTSSVPETARFMI